MRTIVSFLVFIVPFLCIAQNDCSIERYHQLLTEAITASTQGQYSLAINKLQSAKACRPERQGEVDSIIVKTFTKVDGERKEAQRQKGIAVEKAEEARKQTVIAQTEKEKAEAEARHSNNLALFNLNKNTNPTIAVNIAEYCINNYKNDSIWQQNRNDLFIESESSFFSNTGYIEDSYLSEVEFLEDKIVYRSSQNLFSINQNEGLQKIDTIIKNIGRGAMAYLPISNNIITNYNDEAIFSIINIESGSIVQKIDLSSHLGKYSDFYILPFPDENKIVIGNYLKFFIVDAISGEIVNKFAPPLTINSIAFSRDGNTILILQASRNFSNSIISIFDIKKPEESPVTLESSVLSRVVFNSNLPNHIWVLKFDKIEHIDYLTGKIEQVITDNFSPISVACFSNDGKTLALGNQDGVIKLYNVNEGRLIQTLKGHKSDINKIKFSPDDKNLLSVDDDGIFRLWAIAPFKNSKPIYGSGGFDMGIIYSPDEKYYVILGDIPIVKVAQKADDKIIFSLEGHKDDVVAATFQKTKKRLITGSGDETVIIWDLITGTPVKTISGFNSRIRNLLLSPDESLLLVSCNGYPDSNAFIINLETFDFIEHFQGCSDNFAFSPDGSKVIMLKKKPQVYDLINKKIVKSYDEVFEIVAYSPDGTQIIGARNGIVKIIDQNNDRPPLEIKLQEKSDILNISFSDDYKQIFIRTVNNTYNISNIKMIDYFKYNLTDLQSFGLKPEPYDTKTSLKSPSQNSFIAAEMSNDSLPIEAAIATKNLPLIERSARQALKDEPTRHWAKATLANALVAQGRYKDAEPLYKALLKQEKGFAPFLRRDIEKFEQTVATHKDFSKIKALLN